jgi:hypothetical protein
MVVSNVASTYEMNLFNIYFLTIIMLVFFRG